MSNPTKKQLAKWKKTRKAWVKALRSENYTQGQSMLLTLGGEHCCLGVLCDVIGMKPRLKRIRVTNGDMMYYFGNHCDFTPYKAMQSVGLRSSDGSWEPDDEEDQTPSLSHINDNGFSFNDIADIIESEPDGMFR